VRCAARVAIGLAIVSAIAAEASGQTTSADDPRSSGRFEFGAGAIWIGHAGFGSRDATETAATGGRFVLFSASSRLDAAVGVEGRLGVRLSRVVEVDADTSYSTPALRTSITSDVESSASAVATVKIRQFTIGAAVLAHLLRWRAGAHGMPFVEAGAGYLRQLYDTRSLVETGQTYYAGGGVKFTAARRGRVRAIGLRADVRALVRTKGVAIDGRAHVAPAAGASLFVRF